MTEGEIIEWHHQLNGREFEKTPANSVGQEGQSMGVTKNWTRRSD